MSQPKVTLIDYGLGNLLSVQRGLEYCGAVVNISSDPKEILTASRVVLPGVGAFADGMSALRSLGLISAIHELASRNVPLLGICLGMQLLLDESEEFGLTKGLGLIPGKVVPVPSSSLSGLNLKIPHIGWSPLHFPDIRANWEGTLLQDNQDGDSVYFVHSYMAVPQDVSNRLADCFYGGYKISAAIERGNITGCQFHPEKSGPVGLKILSRFCSD